MKYENEVIVRKFEHTLSGLKREYEKWDVRVSRDEHNYRIIRLGLEDIEKLTDRLPDKEDNVIAYNKAFDKLQNIENGLETCRKTLMRYSFVIAEIEEILEQTVFVISLFDQEQITEEECGSVIDASTLKIEEIITRLNDKIRSEEE